MRDDGQANQHGLSPRVRGNLQGDAPFTEEMRSIPARAGEPTRRPISREMLRVYPRACGGTQCSTILPTLVMGLSPRVRGNPDNAGGGGFTLRSIPARAGEPPPVNPLSLNATVYPRACGGTVANRLLAVNDAGLSPRVRGNRRSCRPTPWT